MNSLKFSFVVVVMVVFTFSEQISALVPQYSQFFPINTCDGPHIYTFDTVTDFQNFSSQNVLGISQRGLWMYKFNRSGVPQTAILLDKGSRSCFILTPGDKIISAERVFNSDLDFPQIGFFTEPFYDVTYHYTIIPNQEEYSLPQPMVFKSYAFTGIRSWTVFPNTDFTGTSICLKPTPVDPLERGYQITGEPDSEMTIGSVRLGCDGETESTISRDAENSRPTSIDDSVISKSVIDSEKNEVHVSTQ